MRILIVTGKLAENTVRQSVKYIADVLILNIEVAAFTTPALLKRSIPDQKYDLILVPGLSSGDFSSLEKEIGTPVRLGPKHAIDLGFVLSFAGEISFSQKVPACELLVEKRRISAIDMMKKLEETAVSPLTLKNVKIGGSSRMKVMAEIVDAGHLEKNELIDKIIYFAGSGADIIDLGMSLDTTEDQAKAAVMAAQSITAIPVSIDTLDPSLINAGVDAGVDLVLSLNSENIYEVKDNIIKHSTAAVLIPDHAEDIESLFQNMELARGYGITEILADPVLEPVGHGFVESMNRYFEFRESDPGTPLFFGAGNVTELIDADSIGINSLLSGIAMELEAGILFSPEFSRKAHGSVSELKTASMMMMLARQRNSAPKDLGIDMLVLKEKRKREFAALPENFIESKANEKWRLDPAGCFKIGISEDEIRNGKLHTGMIIANHKKSSIAGATAKEVMDTIIELGLVSKLDHAAYLGRELMKAELALKLKRSYSQDDKF